ncbi:MAG: RagB/SusD family nutrient uptake outer membrane protein, partial [Saprospiraceae bacterium]|nr:RagB/SusD family nutrient uptake outer membrane protein [Saprospiraceae bacterium]
SNSFSEDDAANNWVVFRYTDVLLMLAEALGEGTEAYDLINQVRSRAGLGSIDASTAGSFSEKLLQERRVELAFENHRWADLLRFGAAEATMSAQNKPVNGKLLFAIPQRELDLNSSFTQNPGY